MSALEFKLVARRLWTRCGGHASNSVTPRVIVFLVVLGGLCRDQEGEDDTGDDDSVAIPVTRDKHSSVESESELEYHLVAQRVEGSVIILIPSPGWVLGSLDVGIDQTL